MTRFMAIRAADENGEARGGFGKKEEKKKEPFPPLFFGGGGVLCKGETEDEEYRYVRRQREKIKNK